MTEDLTYEEYRRSFYILYRTREKLDTTMIQYRNALDHFKEYTEYWPRLVEEMDKKYIHYGVRPHRRWDR